MAHKHAQAQIDDVINKWRGKHAVDTSIRGEPGFVLSIPYRHRPPKDLSLRNADSAIAAALYCRGRVGALRL